MATTAVSKKDFLKGVDPDNRDLIARIVEQAQRAADTWTTFHTDFLSPAAVADALRVLQPMAGVAAVPWGGYTQAERCRLILGECSCPSTTALLPSVG